MIREIPFFAGKEMHTIYSNTRLIEIHGSLTVTVCMTVDWRVPH